MYTYTELASIEHLVYQTTIKISCHPFEKENKPMRKNIVLGCESVLHRWDLEEFIDIRSLEQKHCFIQPNVPRLGAYMPIISSIDFICLSLYSYRL